MFSIVLYRHDCFYCLTWRDLSGDHFVGAQLGLRWVPSVVNKDLIRVRHMLESSM